jgi:exopolysaccharide biosynthesis polyprenyl glycosylphosphotransferase
MTKIVKHKKDFNSLLTIIDLIVTVFSYFLAYFLINIINTDYFRFDRDYVIMLILIIPTWAILLYTSNLTTIPRTRSYVSIFMTFINFNFAGFALLFLYKHLFGLHNFSHFVIISFSIINLLSLYFVRILTYKVFKYYRANGHNISNIIIYGDERSEQFIDSLLQHPEWGFRILMIVTNSAWLKKKFGSTIRIYPDKINLKNILDIDIIDEIICCKCNIEDEKIRTLVEMCEEIGVTIRIQPNRPMKGMADAHITHLEHIPFITIKNTPQNSSAVARKSFFEFWVSFSILFILSPIMFLIALMIKVTSKGPVIFKQERVGLRGRKFYMYKFRTMVHNAEQLKAQLEALNESDGPTFKIKRDPRITFIGRILRKTGLDELPQLFNVIKGEMALIGPRPPLPSEVEKYERWHLRRLSVKPGITCTWQIIPNRNEVLFDNWMKLDIQYIDTWSIKNDFQLFIRTIKTVLYGTGY